MKAFSKLRNGILTYVEMDVREYDRVMKGLSRWCFAWR